MCAFNLQLEASLVLDHIALCDMRGAPENIITETE
jgi:hypothetical protein